LRAGDESAFAELVARHEGGMRFVARTFVRTDALAEEVVQDTWLAVLRGLDGFEGRATLKTWIFHILVNRARTRAVREARTIPFSSLTGAEGDEGPAVDPTLFDRDGRWARRPQTLDTDPEHHLLAAELRGSLVDAVAELPEAQRAVIALRDLAGLPSEEVCELLGVSAGNQRVLLHRARTRVRAALAPIVGSEA
jgi:RNA polymerase sigma-70 factor, ECF subfamily